LSNDQFQSTPSGGKATAVSEEPTDDAAFQSTPSGGKATGEVSDRRKMMEVSIHAFRGEGDGCQQCHNTL